MNETPLLQSQVVTTFGSARERVVPDVAEVQMAVSREHETPSVALSATREAARSVSEFLRSSGVCRGDVAMDRAVLEDVHADGEPVRRRIAYRATIALRVVVRNLDLLESLLVGAVDAGAHEIRSVTLSSSQIAVIRAETQKKAIQSAWAKAELFAAAAGVRLGRVFHIEDRTPEEPRKVFAGPTGTLVQALEHDSPSSATPPGSVDVSAAVLVSFSLLT